MATTGSPCHTFAIASRNSGVEMCSSRVIVRIARSGSCCDPLMDPPPALCIKFWPAALFLEGYVYSCPHRHANRRLRGAAPERHFPKNGIMEYGPLYIVVKFQCSDMRP